MYDGSLGKAKGARLLVDCAPVVGDGFDAMQQAIGQ
jgi:hypothetical protein